MKNQDQKNDSDKQRGNHNRDLIRRMRNGDSLTSFDSKSSWFPPRPTIAKDEKELKRLYGNEGSNAALKHDWNVVSANDVKEKKSTLKLIK